MPNLKFWTEPFPDESIEKGKQLLEDLHWNITVKEHKPNLWTVHSGHQLLLQTTSQEAAEALVYGAALAYAAMPKAILTELRKEFDSYAGPQDSKG